jgi:hypothetical protein
MVGIPTPDMTCRLRLRGGMSSARANVKYLTSTSNNQSRQWGGHTYSGAPKHVHVALEPSLEAGVAKEPSARPRLNVLENAELSGAIGLGAEPENDFLRVPV